MIGPGGIQEGQSLDFGWGHQIQSHRALQFFYLFLLLLLLLFTYLYEARVSVESIINI